MTASNGQDLPPGWRWARLADVVREAISGFASGERDELGVIQLRMNNVTTDGRIVWDDYVRVPIDPENIIRYRLEPGDVVFNQ